MTIIDRLAKWLSYRRVADNQNAHMAFEEYSKDNGLANAIVTYGENVLREKAENDATIAVVAWAAKGLTAEEIKKQIDIKVQKRLSPFSTSPVSNVREIMEHNAWLEIQSEFARWNGEI